LSPAMKILEKETGRYEHALALADELLEAVRSY
jgi:hypothetical protein